MCTRYPDVYKRQEFDTRKEMKEDELEEGEPYYIIFAFNKELSLRRCV